MSFKKSLEEILNNASVVLTNASRPEMATLLAAYGYTIEKLGAGRTLLTVASDLFNLQQKEYGDQFEATDTLQDAKEKAEKIYNKHVKLARVAFTDDRSKWQELGLSGERKKSIAGWVAQTTLFYKNSLSSQTIKDALAEYGITEENLTSTETLVTTVVDANAMQEHEKGEAQNATKNRDEAIDELNEWLVKFIKVAKIAFEDNPQTLESFGVVVH